MTKQLLQQALDALQYHTAQTRPIELTNIVIAAIQAALAQPAPVLEAAFAIDAACRNRYSQWDNQRCFSEIAKQTRRREMASEVLAQPVQPAATVIKRGADRQWMSEALGELPEGTYSLYLKEAQPLTLAQPVLPVNIAACGIDRKDAEPVAWRTFDGEGGYSFMEYEGNEAYKGSWESRLPVYKGWVEPLYNHPPKRQPMTKEQIAAIWTPHYSDPFCDYRDFARAIEKHHGIEEPK